MKLALLVLAINFTWMSCHAVFFRTHWRRGLIDYLRERFGASPTQDALNESAVDDYWRENVPLWVFLAAACWAAFGALVGVA